MIKIEKAKAGDVGGIQEVLYRVWLDSYPNDKIGITVADVEERFKDRLSPENLNKRRAAIDNLSPGRLFLVAKDGKKVVGMFWGAKEGGVNELKAIYVLPDYQRQGIGQMFWERALKFFNKEQEVIVHVASYNEKAINFYKGLGFVDTGRRFTDEKFRMPVSGVIIPEMEMALKPRA